MTPMQRQAYVNMTARQTPWQLPVWPKQSFVVLGLMAIFVVGVTSVAEQPGWNWVVKGLGVVMTIAYAMNIWKTGLRVPREALLYVCWIAWTLVALPMVIYPAGFFLKFQTIVMIWVLMMVMSGMTTRRSVLTLVMASVLIGAFLLAVMAFKEGGFWRPTSASYGEYADSSETESYERLSWRGINPNGFGRLMIMGCIAAGYLWLQWQRRRFIRYMVLIPAILVLIAACIFSGSRFSILGMGLATLAFFFWAYRPEVKRNPALLPVALVGMAMLFGFAVYVGKGTAGFERMNRTFLYLTGHRGQEVRGAGTSRVALYADVFEVVLRFPATGVGLLQYPNYSPRGKVTHSDFGEIATSTGIPGALIYYSMWFLLWRRSGRLFRSKRDPADARIGGVFRMILVVLLFSGLGAPVYSAKWVWAMLGAFLGYAMTVEEDDRYLQRQHAWWAAYQQQMLAARAAWRKSQANVAATE